MVLKIYDSLDKVANEFNESALEDSVVGGLALTSTILLRYELNGV